MACKRWTALWYICPAAWLGAAASSTHPRRASQAPPAARAWRRRRRLPRIGRATLPAQRGAGLVAYAARRPGELSPEEMEHLLMRLEVDGIEYYELKVWPGAWMQLWGEEGMPTRKSERECRVWGGSTVCVRRRGFWAAGGGSGFRQLLWVSVGVRTRGGPVLHATDTC